MLTPCYTPQVFSILWGQLWYLKPDSANSYFSLLFISIINSMFGKSHEETHTIYHYLLNLLCFGKCLDPHGSCNTMNFLMWQTGSGIQFILVIQKSSTNRFKKKNKKTNPNQVFISCQQKKKNESATWGRIFGAKIESDTWSAVDYLKDDRLAVIELMLALGQLRHP